MASSTLLASEVTREQMRIADRFLGPPAPVCSRLLPVGAVGLISFTQTGSRFPGPTFPDYSVSTAMRIL